MLKRIGSYFILAGALVMTGCGNAETAAPKETGVSDVPDKKVFLKMGTGSKTGVYYPTGSAIGSFINQKYPEIKCTVSSSKGSVANINALLAGHIQLGIAQSDRQFQVYNGLAEWKSAGKQDNIRSIFSMHYETVVLVAAVDTKIKTLFDLKGKVVNIGIKGSGTRQNVLDIMNNAGLNPDIDFTKQEASAQEAVGLLQDGKIDAYFFTVGHPNGDLKSVVTGARKVLFVPIDSMEKLVADNPYYANATIPVAPYAGVANKEDVPTIGVKATMCTVAEVDDDAIYKTTKAVFENFTEFTKLHPAFNNLKPKDLLAGMTAPVHSGAMKYYKEADMVQFLPQILQPKQDEK
ncbi:MAG: TAXI family TRAP transporter solute-binding subunit [Lentisphaeria bacterium]|nr:TAXI family TRAP transporter solute-binding subunit [Lentisphaeria bacterium]